MNQDEATERELVRLERQYWQSMKDGDGLAAAALSDEPCLVAGAQGVASLDRATLATMLAEAEWKLEVFELSRVEVRMLTEDVAVVAYKVHEELSVGGQRLALDAADSSIWVRRDARWLCAVHTESLAGDPFGRDRYGKMPRSA